MEQQNDITTECCPVEESDLHKDVQEDDDECCQKQEDELEDEEEEEEEKEEDNDHALITTGIRLLSKGNCNDAITCFQNYLRIHPQSFECWQCLANGYLQRGSYNTAVKAFLKAIQLRDGQLSEDKEEKSQDQDATTFAKQSSSFHFYAELKIAEIHRLVHAYEDAVQDYRVILESDPDYIPALIGIAETLFAIAQQAFKDGYIYTGYRSCIQSMDYLGQAAQLRDDLCITYDLLCQCNLIVLIYANREQKNLRLRSIDEGIRYANCALSINCGVSAYWHHLALFYWYSYQEENENTASNHHYHHLLHKTVQCLMNALKLSPKNQNIWNTLGVVAADCLPIAQHCFLKSMRLSIATTESQWNNLAICYLMDASRYVHFADEAVMRAHRAFCEAQSQNPYFANCWIGQALVAENLNHQDTLDLFRHCNTIAYHPVAALKFAYHLLHEQPSLASSADQVRRDLYTLCIDRLCRYVEKDCDYVAYNLLGNLYERLGYQRQALMQFENALTYSTNANEFEKQSILTNFIRNAVHVYGVQQLAKYEEICEQSWQLSSYFAIGYCKQAQFALAMEKLDHALTLVEIDSELYDQIRSLRYLVARRLPDKNDVNWDPLDLLLNDEEEEEDDDEQQVETNDQQSQTENGQQKRSLRTTGLCLDTLKSNVPLRVAIVLDALKQRRFNDRLQRIFAVMIEHPSLLDGLLLTLFNPGTSQKLIHCHPHQEHCWVLHALCLLIHSDRIRSHCPNEMQKLPDYVRVFQQIVIQKNGSMNQLVASHLILALGMLHFIDNDNYGNRSIDRKQQQHLALFSAQAALHLKPHSSKIRSIFACVRSHCHQHQDKTDGTPPPPPDDHQPLGRMQLVQYILTLLY